MSPLEDGSSGIEDDDTGARVSNGRLRIIPADASGNEISIHADGAGYSLQARALLYDAAGNALAVAEDDEIPDSTPGLLLLGRDDAGAAQALPLRVVNNEVVLRVRSTTQNQLLRDILVELRTLNRRMAHITEDEDE